MSTIREVLHRHQPMMNMWCSCALNGPRQFWSVDHIAEELEKAGYRDLTRSAPVVSCPEHIMDGRNELRCWLPAGHEGDHK